MTCKRSVLEFAFLPLLERHALMRERKRERDNTFCSGRVCAGTGCLRFSVTRERDTRILCGTRLCGHGNPHSSRNHGIIPHSCYTQGIIPHSYYTARDYPAFLLYSSINYINRDPSIMPVKWLGTDGISECVINSSVRDNAGARYSAGVSAWHIPALLWKDRHCCFTPAIAASPRCPRSP